MKQVKEQRNADRQERDTAKDGLHTGDKRQRRALAQKGTNIINKEIKDQNLASLAAHFRIVFKHRYLVTYCFYNV